MDQTTRFYSPFATPNAVEVQYIWYMKRGFSHGQWYYSWKAYARGPDKAKPLQPQVRALCVLCIDVQLCVDRQAGVHVCIKAKPLQPQVCARARRQPAATVGCCCVSNHSHQSA